jgi:TolB-like protein
MRIPGLFSLLLVVGGVVTPTIAKSPSIASAPVKPVPLIAVMPLDTQGVSRQEAALIGDAVASRLLASKTCNVMERSQMDQILREQAFQQSGACDNSGCAVEIGKVLSVDRILVGSIGRIGDAWALNLRLVRVETGEVLKSASGKKKGKIADAQQTLVEQVVGDLTGTRKSNAWMWWTAGGVAVAGGAAAAVLLTQEEPSTPEPEPTSGTYKIIWKTAE